MCGPSSQMQQIAGQEQTFSNLLSSHYTQNFGAQSQILQNLTNLFTPIAEKGPDTMGFGPSEFAALQTQAGEGVGAQYAKAQQALGTQLAARGGGQEFLPTGAAATLRQQLGTAAAQEASQEELGITRAGYQLGREKWQEATGGLAKLAQQYDPSAIASQTIGATGQAFQEASDVQQMRNQAQAGIGGLIASAVPFVGKGIAGGLENVASGGSQAGTETGGGFEQFISGGLSALAG